MSFIDLVEGPLFYFAATVFVIGAVWRFVGILRMGGKKDLAPPRGSAALGFIRGNLRHFWPRGVFARRTWIHILGGYSFHIGLFVLVFFGAFHIEFLDQRILGFSWPALPRWGFIIAAEVAFFGLMILWVRRISDPVMRLISDADDHVGSWLTFLVMLSGCFALQQSHVVLRAVHMGLVDVWLIYFPFSRLMHAFTFVLSRGATGATYGRKGMNP
ncbi:MAG TPA: nitrate reductase [Aliiroseovarius sp.]|nr:nitrate reductase [Aliiroseovarius sp.]